MTRCPEFYEKVERDGNFCGMRGREFREAIAYFKDVEKDKGGNPLLSFDKWLKAKRETAKVAKHKTDRFVGTETPKQKTPEVDSCSCESCGGTDEDAVKVALHILRQYDCPVDICESVQKWIKETWG